MTINKLKKKFKKRYNRKKKIIKKSVGALAFYDPTKKAPFPENTVDYKNLSLLKQFITVQGKVVRRRRSGLTAKEQRKISNAIKTARVAGLLPFKNR